MKSIKKAAALVLVFVMVFCMSALSLNVSAATPTNLFDSSSSDIWVSALTYNGSKLSSGSYANIFTTHPINVSNGDTIYWGYFGAEDYCMEIYSSSGSFLKQVKTAEVTANYTGNTVAGVSNNPKQEAWYYYTITTANAGYVRILGNVSAMEEFQVYLNLTGGASAWPGKGSGSGEGGDSGSDAPDSILTGKSALFCGDSITNAVKDELMPYYGWAGRIGTEYNMTWKNAGVSGAALSTIKTSRIINQLHNNSGTNYDYVILHGGVNDAMESGPIGTLTTSKTLSSFDVSSMAGALDEMFYYAKQYWPNAKIGYIVNYATPNSNWGGYTKDMSGYFAMAKKVCDKWEIPYIDLYSGTVEVDGEELSYSYDILKVNTGTNFYNKDAGEVHIGGTGYAAISPYIADWMSKIGVVEEIPDTVPVDFEAENLIDQIAFTAQFNTIYNVKFSGKEAMYTKNGGIAEVNVDGDKLEIYGYKSSTQGTLYVSIDGKAEQAYSLKSNSIDTDIGVKVCSLEFDRGEHNIKIRVEGKAYIDKITLYGDFGDVAEHTEAFDTVEAENNNLVTADGNWKVKYAWKLSGHNALCADANGSKLAFNYYGYNFKLVSYKSATQGKIYISVDGGAAVEVDLSDTSMDSLYKSEVFNTQNLKHGRHTVEITANGKVCIDAILVDGELI